MPEDEFYTDKEDFIIGYEACLFDLDLPEVITQDMTEGYLCALQSCPTWN